MYLTESHRVPIFGYMGMEPKISTSSFTIQTNDIFCIGVDVQCLKMRVNNYFKIYMHKYLFFLIQFYAPFKIISAHMRRVKTGEHREKTPDTPASRTWLVSQVANAGLEPTPETAVR